ncbi:MAG: hypothetical protein A3H51_02900 [Candidatus Spechtbacteria bacterium RIFCSPLOWO2_02_FULL_38_8]|uniref:DUF5680 domain-containing protein n=1 Tax=Candidatus Spechtbacteria bacterium RIFCSPLOWO2_02_FULL_38_8 TaxID=1802164 RepID=A0A1G2HHF5_9BACT|nr:MAG: hypothetical protein A3H51_02900 [Candidatus Spechtbacteria bacterium RIFCSPLOWO2_02_FULL_38_8]
MWRRNQIMDLKSFLVKAKINTYASAGEGGEKVLEDGGREFVYKESEWAYRDRYFGFNPFIGQEVVLANDIMIWGMNYYGRILSPNVDSKQLYGFLMQSLRLVSSERPFRGPDKFQKEEWVYVNESQGNTDNFNGIETIFLKNKKVYELRYHGGVIGK